jgi:hypothetical protein
MATTFSPLLRIELIGQGEQANTWGGTTNTNLGTIIEQAIAGTTPVVLADANYVLTQADGASDEARRAILVVTGNQTQARTIFAPDTSKVYVVRNNTGGGLPIRIQRSSGGNFVEVPPGKTGIVICDGNEFVNAVQYLKDAIIEGGTITGLSTPLAVNSGGTGSTTPDAARLTLSAAKSGVNADITALTGLLTPIPISGGGTNASSAAAARFNLQAARSGINNDITELTALTAPLSLSQGGTGANTVTTPGAVIFAGASSLQQTAVGVAGQVLRSNAAGAPTWTNLPSAVSLVIDGNGVPFASGIKGYIQVPFAAFITAVTVLGDGTGSVVVDIWKDTFADFPPTVADSICGSSKPTISSSNKYTDSTLTGWNRNIVANDILAFNIDSVLNFTKLTVSLSVVRV